MAKPARRRETLHSRAIYRFHPLFADEKFPVLYGDDDAAHLPASIEGGDVHVLGHRAVMIGMGERTSPMGLEIVAQALFHSGQADIVVIAVELPKTRAMMHLDTAMTMVDTATFVLYPYFDRHLRSWTITPGDAPWAALGPAQPQPLGDAGDGPRSGRGDRPHDRRGHPSRRARTMGRRDELPCGRTWRRLRVRAQRRHQHDAAQARHRSRERRRKRARAWPRRAALHDLPNRAGSGVNTSSPAV